MESILKSVIAWENCIDPTIQPKISHKVGSEMDVGCRSLQVSIIAKSVKKTFQSCP